MLRRIQDLLNTTLIIRHELIIRPFMQNHSSTMQLTSPISSENLMQSRLGELDLQSIDVGVADDCFFRSILYHINYLSNRPQVSMVYRLINHLGCW